MNWYKIELKGAVNAETFWLHADSENEARQLLAANGGDCPSDATDDQKYDCVSNGDKAPPPGFIYRRYEGPIAISPENQGKA